MIRHCSGSKEKNHGRRQADRGAQDRNRININEDYEVAYWTKELGVSREQLAEAVKKVGVSAEAVRAEIGRQR